MNWLERRQYGARKRAERVRARREDPFGGEAREADAALGRWQESKGVKVRDRQAEFARHLEHQIWDT